MTAERSILSLRYIPVAARGGVRQAVGALLRYIHYRDQEVDTADRQDIGRMLRYVAHRDRSSSKGRLFNAEKVIGDAERRSLTAYVVRSTAALPRPTEPSVKRPHRAVHQMVLSPEDARGLDLRLVARAMMARLEEDAGPLPPWIAAEHHNTAHPHVHIVLAARREVAPGRFRAVLISRPRLARMKEAMYLEIARQRGERPRLPGELGIRIELRPGAGRRGSAYGGAALFSRTRSLPLRHGSFLFRVQLAARRYRRRLEREVEEERLERSGGRSR